MSAVNGRSAVHGGTSAAKASRARSISGLDRSGRRQSSARGGGHHLDRQNQPRIRNYQITAARPASRCT
jgi:hypothetical protein